MTGVPAHCRHCGAVFMDNSLFFENSTNVTINGSRVSCHRCGKPADIINGTFDFVGNAIKVIKAPPKTIQILTILQAALADSKKGKSDDEVVAKIAEASPELARAIIQKKQTAAGAKIGLAALLLTLMASCSTSTRLDWNQLVDQVHVYQTGKEPYPGLGQQGPPASEPDSKQPDTRQQRRYRERQNKKMQRQIKRQSPIKPSR